MQPTGTMLTPTMDHAISIQPTSMMGPLTQQLGHLSLSSAGTYMPAAAAMQGAYIPQYTPVPSSSVAVEENIQQVTTVPPSSSTLSNHFEGDNFLHACQAQVHSASVRSLDQLSWEQVLLLPTGGDCRKPVPIAVNQATKEHRAPCKGMFQLPAPPPRDPSYYARYPFLPQPLIAGCPLRFAIGGDYVQ
ncbi:RNA-binding motif single-stranded-interacting protein 2 [Crotalus adamanteus]|uniref:RNA-binding motif single-stranded-interacting protein 2 n=1 Tax=Crotalus adamanteus TaxID=8729 RepID=A0AAW1C089_CROAD